VPRGRAARALEGIEIIDPNDQTAGNEESAGGVHDLSCSSPISQPVPAADFINPNHSRKSGPGVARRFAALR
jgi:hypothetical protein